MPELNCSGINIEQYRITFSISLDSWYLDFACETYYPWHKHPCRICVLTWIYRRTCVVCRGIVFLFRQRQRKKKKTTCLTTYAGNKNINLKNKHARETMNTKKYPDRVIRSFEDEENNCLNILSRFYVIIRICNMKRNN